MADTPTPPPSPLSRYAPWLLAGCSVLLVCSLSLCLIVITIARATGPEALLPLIERFNASNLQSAPTTPDRDLLLRDEFSDNRQQWTLYQRRAAEAGLEHGRMQLLVVGPNQRVSTTIPPSFTDFRLEVDSGLFDGPPETTYGVIFRHQDDANYYVFEVDGLGRYRFGKMIQGVYSVVIEPTMSDRVQPGQALNRLRVIAKGDGISLAVNGVDVVEVSDSSFGRGRIGLTASLDDSSQSRVVFDNLQIFRP